MSLIIPNISDQTILKFIFGKISNSDTQTLRLFANNHNPSKNTVLSDLTEASTANYASKNLSASNWNIVTSSNITTASYPEQTFTFNNNIKVYGYYVTTNIDGTNYLLWVERFSVPFELPGGGGTIAVSLNIGVS
jgi:hypothetical protein